MFIVVFDFWFLSFPANHKAFGQANGHVSLMDHRAGYVRVRLLFVSESSARSALLAHFRFLLEEFFVSVSPFRPDPFCVKTR